MSLADLISQNGPSAPAWAFFTALTSGVLLLIGQQLKVHSEVKRGNAEAEEAKSEAHKAAESATKAQKNTANLANGFAGRVDAKLDQIIVAQRDTDKALREHLKWHLDRE